MSFFPACVARGFSLKMHCAKLILVFQGECAAHGCSHSDELDCQSSSGAPEISNCSMGSSEKWMVLSISGDKPTPRFNVSNS